MRSLHHYFWLTFFALLWALIAIPHSKGNDPFLRNLALAALPLLAALLVGGAWRAWWLAQNWRFATAQARMSNYSDFDRSEDMSILGGFVRRNTFGGNYSYRSVEQMLTFKDAEGEDVYVPHNQLVPTGMAPEYVFNIWHNPDNPEDYTTFGPPTWTVLALGAGLTLICLIATRLA